MPSAGQSDMRAAPAPPSASTSVPAPAAAATTAPSETTAGGSVAADSDVTGGQFEIVVASFRTDERAAAVVAEVSNLGFPVRRRVIGGWHQVIAGPFASRAAADEVQQRLTGAGLTQTVVVRQNQTARSG